MLSYLQASVIGLLQGVTELFPISSLGHSVLVPALIGGSWQDLVTQASTGDSGASPYLAFIVALHVATAIALLVYFRADWSRIVRGFVRSIGPTVRNRRVTAADPDERLAWLLIIATIPVGITGLLLEHTFRTIFAKPLAAAVFLTVNGVILLVGEQLRRRAPESPQDPGTSAVTVATTLTYRQAGVIGAFQTFALLAGISRAGITMVGALTRGLSHRDAAHFAFLLATPVILAAGVLKLPTLAGPAGAHIHGQILVGAVLAGLASYVCVRWLTRYFQTRTLTPFAVYSLLAGALCVLRFAV